MEKGICYLICSIYTPTYFKDFLKEKFWKLDGELMSGILLDMPDDAWNKKSELQYECSAGTSHC